MERKPFKETAVGQWITSNAPHLIQTIENFVPAPIKGGLDILRNIIQKDDQIPPEKKEEFMKLADQHELDLITAATEQNRLDVENTENAREMYAKGDRWTKITLLCIVVFVGLIWGFMAVYISLKVMKLIGDGDHADMVQVFALFTAVSAIWNTIINFYFGSTQNGREMVKSFMNK